MAIKGALGEKSKYALVSSTKSMTGICPGARGPWEAVAAIFALREKVIPPTIGLLEPDTRMRPRLRAARRPEGGHRSFLVPSLGFGGHNACLAFVK
jgi:3-oxoacyl-[acyl-carrier-protein] synthase II